MALCYYKLDYYDVSQEVLAVYLQSIPDSTIALNLKACNHFRLYNGKAAEVNHALHLCNNHMYPCMFLCYHAPVGEYKNSNKSNLHLFSFPLGRVTDFRFDLMRASSPSQAELKNLIDISSCSFEFAKELIRHNLVSSSQALSVRV